MFVSYVGVVVAELPLPSGSDTLALWENSEHVDAGAGGVTNNHYLSGSAACLKLLPPGEQAVIPQYDVPDDVTEYLSLRFGQCTNKPVCRTCYWMVKKNSPRTGLSLETQGRSGACASYEDEVSIDQEPSPLAP